MREAAELAAYRALVGLQPGDRIQVRLPVVVGAVTNLFGARGTVRSLNPTDFGMAFYVDMDEQPPFWRGPVGFDDEEVVLIAVHA